MLSLTLNPQTPTNPPIWSVEFDYATLNQLPRWLREPTPNERQAKRAVLFDLRMAV